jgi:tripartite-type tricarboxylate transporter receptor subunit TctC
MNALKLLFAKIAAALLVSLLSVAASAQQYPVKPVRVIAAYPPGSGPDTVIRIVGEKLTRSWGGQALVVENRPGGNGLIAVEAVKRAPADGYTLLLADNAHLSAHPHLYKQLPYDTNNDFTPVAMLFQTYFFIVVSATSPWKNIGDLVAAAKAKDGKMTYGSWGIGSIGHIAVAIFEAATNTRMTHIPYQGTTQVYPAVGNGEIDWALGSVASSSAVYRAGKVRYLAAASPKRIVGFPDIPTVAELGGPADFEARGWVALMAPRGTPAEIVAKLNSDVVRALNEPDVKERLNAVGFEPYPSESAEIARAMGVESRRFGEIIKRAKISLD